MRCQKMRTAAKLYYTQLRDWKWQARCWMQLDSLLVFAGTGNKVKA